MPAGQKLNDYLRDRGIIVNYSGRCPDAWDRLPESHRIVLKGLYSVVERDLVPVIELGKQLHMSVPEIFTIAHQGRQQLLEWARQDSGLCHHCGGVGFVAHAEEQGAATGA